MHTANIEIRECVKWSLKNNRKSLTFRPKKWSWSLTGGGRLLGVSTVRLRLGKFGFLDRRSLISPRPAKRFPKTRTIFPARRGVAYFMGDKWSLTRGGHTWMFDCKS